MRNVSVRSVHRLAVDKRTCTFEMREFQYSIFWRILYMFILLLLLALLSLIDHKYSMFLSILQWDIKIPGHLNLLLGHLVL
jgi:uncharacterized integral membrane protein